jgi:hypothetical protein
MPRPLGLNLHPGLSLTLQPGHNPNLRVIPRAGRNRVRSREAVPRDLRTRAHPTPALCIPCGQPLESHLG